MTGQDNQVDNNHHDSKKSEVVMERIKHPLRHRWSFWMFTNKKQNWEENLIKLTTFDTVEDYWCLYHHMKRPSELELGQEYAVFKNDIRPMWEDNANRSGGRWLINFEGTQCPDLNTVWLFVILLMIGENFENNDAICGVIVNIRTKSKIGVWLSDAKNNKAIMEIGKKLKDFLGIQNKMNFHKHNVNHNKFTL